MSNAGVPVRPRAAPTKQAVDGKTISGVMVAQMIRSISLRFEAGGGDGLAGGGGGEGSGGFAFGGDAALVDAGALGDPFVVGVDHLRQIVVGQPFFRQLAAVTGEDG